MLNRRTCLSTSRAQSFPKLHREQIRFLHPDLQYDGLSDQGGDAGVALPADTVVEGVAEDQVAVFASEAGDRSGGWVQECDLHLTGGTGGDVEREFTWRVIFGRGCFDDVPGDVVVSIRPVVPGAESGRQEDIVAVAEVPAVTTGYEN